MPKIMFWNTNLKDSIELAAIACDELQIDILVLAECDIESTKIISKLNQSYTTRMFSEFVVAPSYVRLFIRYPQSMFTPLFENGRSSIRAFDPPIGLPLIIVMCHLPSKMHKDADNQYYVVRQLVQEIYNCEKLRGHSNTIVIGDLNINPFESAMVAADGFHATMDKNIALKGERIAQGKPWKFFFNPSWSNLGDETAGPPGTYYYNSGGDLFNLYWHNFDQCLIRPEIIPFYEDGAFSVITSIQENDLLKNTKINTDISDHLPIMIDLKTERAVR